MMTNQYFMYASYIRKGQKIVHQILIIYIQYIVLINNNNFTIAIYLLNFFINV